MGRNRVDHTSYNSLSLLMKREKICEKGTQIAKESLACERGLSSDTFAGWNVDVGSLGKILDWELHPFSHPGPATDFLGELSK